MGAGSLIGHVADDLSAATGHDKPNAPGHWQTPAAGHSSRLLTQAVNSSADPSPLARLRPERGARKD